MDGFEARRLTGNHRPVPIPKNTHLVVIEGKTRRPNIPEGSVCFSVPNLRDTEFYYCSPSDFEEFCRSGGPKRTTPAATS